MIRSGYSSLAVHSGCAEHSDLHAGFLSNNFPRVGLSVCLPLDLVLRCGLVPLQVKKTGCVCWFRLCCVGEVRFDLAAHRCLQLPIWATQMWEDVIAEFTANPNKPASGSRIQPGMYQTQPTTRQIVVCFHHKLLNPVCFPVFDI